MQEKFPYILDVTIRDGSYLINHQYSPERVAEIAKSLSQSGIEYAEISHGYGIGARMMGYPGLADDDELMEAAQKAAPKLKIVAFISSVPQSLPIIPSIVEYIEMARVALNLDKPETSKKIIQKLKKYNKKVAIQLTRAHRRSPEAVAKTAKEAEAMGADLIYLVDTFGSMNTQDIKNYLEAIRAQVKVSLGFHGHNNLGLAIPNTLEAYRSGARWLDASLLGVGRGAGNASLETLINLMQIQGFCSEINLEMLNQTTQNILLPLFNTAPYSSLVDILLAGEKLDYSAPENIEVFAGLLGMSLEDFLTQAHAKVGMDLELQDIHIKAVFKDFGVDFDKIQKTLSSSK